MRRMILVKSLGAALVLAVMAGFAGQASAGLREYCDSYARDVAHRKTNGGADIGAGATSARYKRAYTKALELCIDNYEGQRVLDEEAKNEAPRTEAPRTEATRTEATSTEAPRTEAPRTEATRTDATSTEAPRTNATRTKATRTKVAKKTAVAAVKIADATEKAEPGKPSWSKACARKYRSWDPQKGKYKSYSGKWKPCRL